MRIEFMYSGLSFLNKVNGNFTLVRAYPDSVSDFEVSIPERMIENGTRYNNLYGIALCGQDFSDFDAEGLKLYPFSAMFPQNAKSMSVYVKCFDEDTCLYFFVPITLIKPHSNGK